MRLKNKMKDEKNIEAKLISEKWEFCSRFDTGSDYGVRVYFFCPSENLGVLLVTRDRIVGAQETNWVPSDKEDHYFDEQRTDLEKIEIIECGVKTLEGQVEIFKARREEQTEHLEYSYSDFKIQDVSLSIEELNRLRSYKPNFSLGIFEVDSPLVKWLYEKLKN